METKIRSLTHPWNLSPKDARTLQIQLSRRVVREPEINIENVTTVTGVDTHYQGDLSLAVAVTIRLPELETVECSTALKRATFPYVSGLLAFREGPAILAALKNLITAPDLLMFDGHGIAHPRRCGLASHIGLLMDRPSIEPFTSSAILTYPSVIPWPFPESAPTRSPRERRDYIPLPEYQNNLPHFGRMPI